MRSSLCFLFSSTPLFLSGALAQNCKCFTATVMKDATNCATPACQISFTSYIPIKDPACPTTSTVTLNQPCATGRECSTVWTTVLSTPTACGTGSVTSGPVVSTTVTKSTKTTTTTKSTPTGPIPDDACLPQPISDNLYGITVDPASAFTGSAAIAGVANDAVTPIGYKLIFRNRLASVSADKFLGVRTLGSYDPFTCADYCDKTTGCSAFNIFFERDPTLDPGEYCPDPPGTPNIKCTLWGVLLDSTMATNTGQGRYKFRVAIAGSNGYTAYTPVDGVISAVPAGRSSTKTSTRSATKTP